MNQRVEGVLTASGVLRVALYGALLFLFTRTYADADLWGHVRFGIDIVTSRAIPAVDPYTFTSDVLWVNHEWLAEVLMGAAWLAGGNTGLVWLKLLVAGFVGAVLIVTLRNAGWRGRYLDLVLTLALLTTFFRLQYIRPQLFSIACFTGLLLIVRTYDHQRRWALWLLPPLFVLWVNTHGGFIVGLAVLGLWAIFDLASASTIRQRTILVLAVAASGAATLINPYGLGLWRFIQNTVGLNRPEILDWIPLWKFPPGILMLELIFPLVVVVALLRGRRRPPAANIAMAGFLGLLTIRVSRLDVFFHLSLALLLLPCAATPSWPKVQRQSTGARRGFYAATAAVLIVAFAAVAMRNAARIEIGTVVPERDALVYVRDAAGAGRVLTWYNWGQYGIWHLASRGIKVSMDGRRETVYSDRVVDDHFRFYRGEPALVDYPERIGADAIWLPSDFAVIQTLVTAGWQVVYKSDISTVLLPPGPRRQITYGGPDRGQVFPGP